MTLGALLFLILFVLATAISTLSAIYLLLKYPRTLRVKTGALLLLAGAEWTLCYALELGAATLSAKLFWDKMQFLGIAFIPGMCLVFTLDYTGRHQWLSPRNLAIVGLFPLLLLVLAYTNQFHGFIWTQVALSSHGPFIILDQTFGWGLWAFIVYSCLLFLIGTAFLIQMLIRSPHLYRWQSSVLLFGAFLPFIVYGIQLSGLNPLHPLELTPLAFVATAIIVALNLTRFRRGDIVPVVHATYIEEMSDPVIVLDHRNCVVYRNRAAQDLMGHVAHGAPGQAVEKIWPEWQSQIEHAPPVGSKGREMVLDRGDGQRIYDVLISPFFDRKGDILSRLVVLRDITGRKRAEETLRESEEKYRSLVTHASDAIFIVQDGVIKFPNPSTLALTRYSIDEHATIPFAKFIHPEDRDWVVDRQNRRLKGEEVPGSNSFRLLTKRGEELWVDLNTVLITWEGGRALLCYMRDITSLKRLEAQYLHAQKMEAVNTLAGGIAHEFNNLLQTILGYTEVLFLERKESDCGYRELREIEKAALRGVELIQHLLIFSRKIKSKQAPVQLNLTVKQVQKLLTRTIPRMVKVEPMLVDDLRLINADSAQMEQVLINLAINSVDAMPEGGKLIFGTENVTVDEEYCKFHPEAKPGDYVLLTVSDTGRGMDQQTLGHLFEPFYTTKEVGKGTGLGLSAVYGIVMDHHGFIQCDSELGEGTTFKIYLPAIKQIMEGEVPAEEGRPRGGMETILVVDDEESIRGLCEEILGKYGYQVLTASDGETALNIYQEAKEKIDLIILDLIMPGMGGRKCLEELIKMNPEVKVLISSGNVIGEPPGATLKTGAKRFIRKPYTLREMLQVIRDVMEN